MAALPIEYRNCLMVLCQELGIVMVPVGTPWRASPSLLRLARALGAGTRWIKSAEADRCHRAWAHLWPASRQANRELVEHIVHAVRRDPGTRILVAVRIEHRYAVVEGLCPADEVGLVPV